jgi:hypothetical protein
LIHLEKDSNILIDLSLEEYKIMRKRIISCVLATDMTLHNKEYTYLRVKLESHSIKNGENVHKIFENQENINIFNIQQDFMNILLHCADISNPTKPLEIYKSWADLVLKEFWDQGDLEKKKSLPISFLCDRNTTKIHTSQLGFIDMIAFPMFEVVVEFFPNLQFLIENLNNNKLYYKSLKENEEKQIK